MEKNENNSKNKFFSISSSSLVETTSHFKKKETKEKNTVTSLCNSCRKKYKENDNHTVEGDSKISTDSKIKSLILTITSSHVFLHFVSGGFAGAVSRTITAPLDRLKILMQVDISIKKKKIIQLFRKVYVDEGFLSFFKGNGANCVKVIPESAIKFFAYDYFQRQMVSYKNGKIAQNYVKLKCTKSDPPGENFMNIADHLKNYDPKFFRTYFKFTLSSFPRAFINQDHSFAINENFNDSITPENIFSYFFLKNDQSLMKIIFSSSSYFLSSANLLNFEFFNFLILKNLIAVQEKSSICHESHLDMYPLQFKILARLRDENSNTSFHNFFSFSNFHKLVAYIPRYSSFLNFKNMSLTLGGLTNPLNCSNYPPYTDSVWQIFINFASGVKFRNYLLISNMFIDEYSSKIQMKQEFTYYLSIPSLHKTYFFPENLECTSYFLNTSNESNIKDKQKMNKVTGKNELSLFEKLVAGGAAGCTAQFLIYPLEIAKTRLALSSTGVYFGIFDCLKQSYKKDGIRSLYRGLFPSILGIIPYAGIDLSVFDSLKRLYIEFYGTKRQNPIDKNEYPLIEYCNDSPEVSENTFRKNISENRERLNPSNNHNYSIMMMMQENNTLFCNLLFSPYHYLRHIIFPHCPRGVELFHDYFDNILNFGKFPPTRYNWKTFDCKPYAHDYNNTQKNVTEKFDEMVRTDFNRRKFVNNMIETLSSQIVHHLISCDKLSGKIFETGFSYQNFTNDKLHQNGFSSKNQFQSKINSEIYPKSESVINCEICARSKAGDNDGIKPNAILLLFFGAISCSIGQIVAYPTALIRTRMQADGVNGGTRRYNNCFHALKLIIMHEGFTGLYKGLFPNLIKTIPAVSISWFLYENSRYHITKWTQ